ncbi:MAG TPA: hypothetical protein VJH23_00600 [archaeon]|nr:hypothetical protein [archaeon]
MDFLRSVRAYLGNFPTALAFALLLIFVFPLAWLSNAFVSSGTVLIGYGFLKAPPLESLLLLAISLAFLFFYSILVCVMVLSVRRDLSAIKTNYYLSEKIQKFGFKYFKFLAAFTVIAAVASSLLLDAGVPLLLVNLCLLVISAVFLFLPQTIVVDEESLGASVLSNWDFMRKNLGTVLIVMIFGIVALAALQFLEFLVDYFFMAGNFLSLLIALIVLVPLFEAVKTQIYMERFTLIRDYEKFASR